MLQNDEEVEFFVDTLTDFVCRRDLTCAFNVSRVHNYILELIIDLLEVKASYRPETSMKDFYEEILNLRHDTLPLSLSFRRTVSMFVMGPTDPTDAIRLTRYVEEITRFYAPPPPMPPTSKAGGLKGMVKAKCMGMAKGLGMGMGKSSKHSVTGSIKLTNLGIGAGSMKVPLSAIGSGGPPVNPHSSALPVTRTRGMAAATAAAASTTDNTEGNSGAKRTAVAPRERGPIVWIHVPQHETFDSKAPTEPPPGYTRLS